MTTGRYLWLGLLGGLLGGVFMALVEMGNQLVMGHSIFTPMHMIAAPVVGQDPMMNAMKGGTFYLEPLPVLLGMVGHFLWSGVIWGSLFGLIASVARLAGQAALWSALLYGVVVGFFMSAVVVPAVGMKPLWESDGWVPFLLMHLAYGLGPAIVVSQGTRPAAAPAESTAAPRKRVA